MKTIIMKLNRDSRMYRDGLGHCQITYTSKNDKGEALVYCLQDSGEKYGGIRLMRCSQDGEPSHGVSFPADCKVIWEKPSGESLDKTELLAIEWIDQFNSKGVI